MRLFYLLLFGVSGVIFMSLSLINAEWYFQYLITRQPFRKLGRTGSRVLTALIGLALVMYGAAVYKEWI